MSLGWFILQKMIATIDGQMESIIVNIMLIIADCKQSGGCDHGSPGTRHHDECCVTRCAVSYSADWAIIGRKYEVDVDY